MLPAPLKGWRSLVFGIQGFRVKAWDDRYRDSAGIYICLQNIQRQGATEGGFGDGLGLWSLQADWLMSAGL